MKASEIKTALKMMICNGKTQRITPNIVGKPGIGKSEIVKDLGKELGYEVIDIRLSQHDNTDVKGIPNVSLSKEERFSKWLPPEFMPIEGNPKYMNKDGSYKKVILLLDELNRAAPDVIQSVFEIVYDYAIGGNKLIPTCYVVTCGNLGFEDGCEVNDFDAAMNDRLCTLHYEEDREEWLQWAAEHGIRPEIIGFIKAHPKYFYFEVDSKKKLYVTPRRWAKFSRVIEDNPDMTIKQVTLLLGSSFIHGAAPVFMQYLTELETITAKDILREYSRLRDKIKQFELSRIAQLNDMLIEEFKQRKQLEQKEIRNLNEYIVNHLPEDMLLGFWHKVSIETPEIGKKYCKEFPEMDQLFTKIIKTAIQLSNNKTAQKKK